MRARSQRQDRQTISPPTQSITQGPETGPSGGMGGSSGGGMGAGLGLGRAGMLGNSAVIDLVERRRMAEEAVATGTPDPMLEAEAIAEARAAREAFGIDGELDPTRMEAEVEEAVEEEGAGPEEEEEAPAPGTEEAPVEEAAPADGDAAPEPPPEAPVDDLPVDEMPGGRSSPRPPGAGGGGGGGPRPPAGSVSPVSAVGIEGPTPAHDAIVTDIWEGVYGATPQVQSEHAGARMADLAAIAAANQAELDIHGKDVGGQIDALVAERVGRLDATFESAMGEVRARFTGIRGQVQGALDAALAQVDTDVQSVLGGIDQSLQTRLGEIGTGFDDAANQVGTLQSNGVQAFTDAWQQRVDAIRQAGEDRASQALGVASNLGASWQGGEGIEADRNEARRAAAQEVAERYASEMRAKATQAADELAQGIGQIPEVVRQLVEPVTTTLSEQRVQAEDGLRQAAETARGEARKQAETVKQSLTELRGTLMTELDSQEQGAIDGLQGARDSARSGLVEGGEAIKAQIEGASDQLTQSYAEMMEQARLALTEGDSPLIRDVEAAMTEIQGQIDAVKAEQLAGIDQAAQGAISDLDGKLEEGLAGLQGALQTQLGSADNAGQAALESIQEMSTGFSQGMVDLGTQFDTSLGEQSAQAVAGAQQTLVDTQTALTDTQNQWMADLDSSRDSVIGELDNALGQCQSECRSKAEEAAAQIQEQSWWEKAWDVFASIAGFLASIAVGLIVFVAIAAFCIATFGAGPLALIAAGAIAGAIAAVAGKFANDAVKSLLTWSNQFGSWQEYLQTAIVGAVGGAIFGAFANSAAQILPKVAAALGTSLTDQITDILIFGESWNWAEFLIMGTVTFGLSWALGKSNFLKNLGTSFQNRVFPPDARGNSWNGFQSFARNTPLLRNLTTSQRATLWNTAFVQKKVTGSPRAIVEGLVNIFTGFKTDPDRAGSHDSDQQQFGGH